ncbi:MAG TPA: alpha/beta fold hydrolase [Nocardioides sp.]|nr:alpha/beta fold hydrolase [Nocardioides sp.]
MAERITSVRRDGLTFDVFDEGPLDGEVVVLLHGFPERSTTWRSVAPLLHERGYRTIAMDQRGYSPGARPERRWNYRISQLTDDVLALIDRVGGPVHLVGHDWGAVPSWAVAIERPDQLRTLTAVSVPHPMAFLRATVTSQQFRKSYYIALFQLPFLPEWLAGKPGGRVDTELRKGGMTGDEVARFRREIVDDGALHYALMWYRAVMMVDPRLSPNRKVRVPTTFVWSDRDVACDRRGAELTEQYVDAPYELVVLEGVSHWIPTQAPEPLAEAIIKRIESE